MDIPSVNLNTSKNDTKNNPFLKKYYKNLFDP